jgi:glycosyltransferase involved in cell wall biosynthesis
LAFSKNSAQACPEALEPNGKPLETSVVLATCNGAKYLTPLLHSLANQSRSPSEIIITDDNSTDATLSIVSEFAQQTAIPVRLLRNDPALGYADNFLQGALHATGDLVAFCDQDDVWDARKIETAAAAFADASILLATHKARLIDAQGEVIGHFSQDISGDKLCAPRSLDPWRVFFGFSITFRRALLTAVHPRLRGVDYVTGNKRLSHDRWIVFLANMLGRTRLISKSLVDYRQHGNNLFGVHPHLGNASKTRILASAARYRRAAAEFRALIGGIPDEVAAQFPLFDRARCDQFWARALWQQEARQKVYCAPSRTSAFFQGARNCLAGVYKNTHDGKLRWQSAAKDFAYPLMAKHE